MVKKIIKKRGVKPGTKRGKYRQLKVTAMTSSLKIGDTLKIRLPDNPKPAPIVTLCGQLEEAIMLLETRISSAIYKINSLM